MIKFIHLSDVHLGLQLNKVNFSRDIAEERRDALWRTFEKTVLYASKEACDFLFIVGDLYEEEFFSLGDIKRVRDILAEAKNVNILIAAGNHDYLHTKSAYRLVDWSENVYIFDSKFIEKKEYKSLDTAIFGYSWDRKEIKDNKLFNNLDTKTSCKNKILLLHGDLDKNSNYLPLDIEELKKLDFDYIALGHIHKPEIIAPNIAYSGNLEPTNFGEPGDRGFISGKLGKELKLEFKPVSKRKFFINRIKIDENMTYKDIRNKFFEIAKKDKNFYRIVLDGYIQNDINKNDLFREIKDSFYYIEIIDRTVPDYDIEALERDYKDGIIGEFISTMKSDDLDNPIVKDALYLGLDALLKERVDK